MTHAEILAYLKRSPHSTARQICRGLGQAGNRYQTDTMREYLGRLEKNGRVQRTKAGANNSPWRWEAT